MVGTDQLGMVPKARLVLFSSFREDIMRAKPRRRREGEGLTSLGLIPSDAR